MRRVFIIAKFEFAASVRSKAFILGVLFVPLFMAVGVMLQLAAERRAGRSERAFAVVDESGLFYEAIERRAREHNGEPEPTERYLPSRETPGNGSPGEIRLRLARRVRAGELFAFVEIPAAVLDGKSALSARYYSEHATHEGLRRFIAEALNQEIRALRFRAASIDRDLVLELERPVEIEHLELPERATEREGARPPERVDELKAFIIPAIMMGLLFLVAMGSAGRLITSVLEEKMSRIGEVLLGAVTPFELMMGKLLSAVATAEVIAAVYALFALALASGAGFAHWLTFSLAGYFFFFLALDVFFLGALFIAVGAACSDLKDTQSQSTPVMLVVMIPAFLWPLVLRDPTSGFAVALSLFPPATPTIMLLRLSTSPPPPAWQVLAGIALTMLSTVLAVWGAAKIFRTGLLMQGKAATLREMARWVMSK
jgi:ABC-2 type transport system permease protein